MTALGTGSRRWAVIAAAVLAAGLLAAVALPTGARADELAYRDCITGDPELGQQGSGACDEVAHGGLLGAGTAAISPDGKSLYTGSYSAVTSFVRDTGTGALAYQGCIGDGSSAPGAAGCRPLRNGWLSGADFVAVSPDGESLYVAGEWGDTVTWFERDPSTGVLTLRDCITGGTPIDPAHPGPCTQIPRATRFGDDSGIGTISGLQVSPDGNTLYVTSGRGNGCCDDDASIAWLPRQPDGAITYGGCISGNSQLGPSGSDACGLIPSATGNAVDSGLSPETMALSRDGRSVYTSGGKSCEHDFGETFCYGSSGLGRFQRNPMTGALAWRGCLTGDNSTGPSGSGACDRIPSGKAGLPDEGLVVTPDGQALYGGLGPVIARFARDPTGRLSYDGCTTGAKNLGPSGSGDCDAIPTATGTGIGSASGLWADSLVSSPDGSTIYAGGASTVAELHRDAGSGDLTFRDCVSGDLRQGPSGSDACTQLRSAGTYGQGAGLAVFSLSLSPNGKSLYAIGNMVARLGFAPQTSIAEHRIRRHRAKFAFDAARNSTFECKLTGKRVRARLERWRSCGPGGLAESGTQHYGRLHRGKKVFRVRAADEAGNRDPTPAKRSWTVRR